MLRHRFVKLASSECAGCKARRTFLIRIVKRIIKNANVKHHDPERPA